MEAAVPFDPSGNFTRLYDWTDDRDNGIKIDSGRMDAEFQNYADAINAMFSGSQAFRAPAKTVYGTAAAPGWSFEGDTNTGMYRAAADTLGLAAGATDVRISSAGITFNGAQMARENRANTFTADQTFSGAIAASGTVSIDANTGVLNLLSDNTSSNVVSVAWKDKDNNSPWRVELQTDNSLNFLRGTAASGKQIKVYGNQIWHAGNDGAGSGLDADQLDGYQASAFPRLSAANTFTASNSFTTVNINPNSGGLFFNSDGTVSRVCAEYQISGTVNWRTKVETNGDLNFTSPTSRDFLIKGEKAWHAGNDGTGSGLDADLLDGYQATAFPRLSASNTFTGANKFDSGVEFNPNGSNVLFDSDGAANRTMIRAQVSGVTKWNLNQNTNGDLNFSSPSNDDLLIKGNIAYHAGNLAAAVEALLGLTVPWASVTRAMTTAYQNTTGHPLEIAVSWSGSAGELQVSTNGTTWLTIVSGPGPFAGFIPVGHYYRLLNGGTIYSWTERR